MYVCISMYVCIYIHACIHRYIDTYIQDTYIHIHTYIYIYIYIYVYTYTHTYIHEYMCIHTQPSGLLKISPMLKLPHCASSFARQCISLCVPGGAGEEGGGEGKGGEGHRASEKRNHSSGKLCKMIDESRLLARPTLAACRCSLWHNGGRACRVTRRLRGREKAFCRGPL